MSTYVISDIHGCYDEFISLLKKIQFFYLYARDDAYLCGGVKDGMVVAGHTPTILEDEKIFYQNPQTSENKKNLYLDGIMGLVVGDALGVPVEFSSREERKQDPVMEMRGFGTYPVPKGSWSDDSSMALASLSALYTDGLNLKKTMDNFVAWEKKGEFTPSGVVFDEGITCQMAIRNYMKDHDITMCGIRTESSNGNGSLMRILPVCIYLKYMQEESGLDNESAVSIVHQMSALTHAHLRSKMACGIYFFCVKELAKRKQPLQNALQNALEEAFTFYERDMESRNELKHFANIRDLQKLKQFPEIQIKSGGYVIESIEAALWCLLNTSSYEEGVLKAVNLGHDTDTTAAIVGGLAGVYYGYDAIPEKWKTDIIRRSWMEEMCSKM